MSKHNGPDDYFLDRHVRNGEPVPRTYRRNFNAQKFFRKPQYRYDIKICVYFMMALMTEIQLKIVISVVP
jgi:hypothetical protein